MSNNTVYVYKTKQGSVLQFHRKVIVSDIEHYMLPDYRLTQYSILYTLNILQRQNGSIINSLYFLSQMINRSDRPHGDIVNFIAFCESFAYYAYGMQGKAKYKKEEYIQRYLEIMRIYNKDEREWVEKAFLYMYEIRNSYIHGAKLGMLVYDEFSLNELGRYFAYELLNSYLRCGTVSVSDMMTPVIKPMVAVVREIRRNKNSYVTNYYTDCNATILMKGVDALMSVAEYQRTLDGTDIDSAYVVDASVNTIRNLSRTSAIESDVIYYGDMSDQLSIDSAESVFKTLMTKMQKESETSGEEFRKTKKIFEYMAALYDYCRLEYR